MEEVYSIAWPKPLPTLIPMSKSQAGPSIGDEEEKKGLLASSLAEQDDDLELSTPKDRSQHVENVVSRRKLTCIAASFIALLVTGTLARTALFGGPNQRQAVYYDLQSNGTHQFKPTVLLVSIDGLRADYLDRGLTPHLLALSKKGIRAKSMKPIFPTLTFPNHWALMTGLHAESHGIIANEFWDPATKTNFRYNRVENSWDARWWLGEPMWESAEKGGLITANLMWPGPPKTRTSASSTYYVPFKNKVPLDNKLNQILSWIDLPDNKRPQLILTYEPSLDQAGHLTGPFSKSVNESLAQIDLFAKNIHDSLESRNLTNIVDVIFVSDHGMTDTSHPAPVYIDDILEKDGVRSISHLDGWPSMGIRWREGANETLHLEKLAKAAKENPDKFEVYTHETMPERYHFVNNERIAPVYVIPKIGYILTTRNQGEDGGMSKGNHGYDNDDPSMHAIFVAHGPFSLKAKVQHQRRAMVDRTARASSGWYSASEGSYIMDTFPNVEIYNLILTLLNVKYMAAPTNGTVGFWDRYL